MNKQKWMQAALDLGMEGLEITTARTVSRELTWFEGKMDTFVNSKILYTSFRALVEGKIVSVSLEKVDDDKMIETLTQLRDTAQYVSDSEKDIFVGVMETTEEHSNKVWIEPEASAIQAFLADLEQRLLAADPRVKMVNQLGFESVRNESELTNSLGVQVQDGYQMQAVVADITMVEGEDLRDGYLVRPVYDLASFDVEGFVQQLIDKVASTLNAKSCTARTCPVIFEKEAMSTLLSCFAGMFSGDLIFKGISPIATRLNEKVFSDKITMIDDPRNLDAIHMQNYDDEGHPTYKKTLIDQGVFKTILHNTRSAIKMNAESTGNGFKSGAGATGVSPMNLYIQPGDASFDDLLKKMDNGVVITDLQGMHAGVDFVSGNFSLQAKGYLVNEGKKVRPLTLITVAGNFLELLNDVQAVGDDLEWQLRSITSPSILFNKAAIGGNE